MPVKTTPPRSMSGGLALPPRQAALPQPSVAALPQTSTRLRIAAGITAATSAIRRAVAEQGIS